MQKAVNSAVFDGANPTSNIWMDANKYGRRAALLRHQPLQIKSGHIGQLQVGDDAGGGILSHTVQEFARAAEVSDLDTGRRELAQRYVAEPCIACDQIHDVPKIRFVELGFDWREWVERRSAHR